MSALKSIVASHPGRGQLFDHRFLAAAKTATLDRAQVATILGQWWYPLHYFPEFLSRSIAVATDLRVRTSLADILNEELGEGTVERAHERIYVDTMTRVGFQEHEIVDSPALPETRRLVEGYRAATESMPSALGFVYGTEVADLVMVSTIGRTVHQVTGVSDLEWVNIHVRQEPNHVSCVDDTLEIDMSEEQQRDVVRYAEMMWTLWADFFSGVERAVFGTAAAS
jgi:pyrroloquinoline quinone (PQQ) biosynthesis protein C